MAVQGRPVAIKEFKVNDDDPDAEEVRRTSRREVALLKALNHPHIVKYLDEFYDKEKLFVVMEFVPRNLLEVREGSH
jgi:cyclin-dependent kinase-like